MASSDPLRRLAPLVLGVVLVAWVVGNARNRYTESDSFPTLLVASRLLNAGELYLDPLIGAGAIQREHWAVKQKNGRSYDYFPLGTPLFALPYVALKQLLGYDVRDQQENRATQIELATACVTLAFVLSFLLARRFLPPLPACLLSLTFCLGSSYASTMGTALWSLDLTVVFLLLALRALVGRELGAGLNPWWLGFLLWSAYVCRPITALFILAVFGYLGFVDRGALLRTAGVAAALLATFMLFSWVQLGQLLPDYYLPGRLSVAGKDDTAYAAVLYANVLSPSRGLFIYSPFLILPLATVAVARRSLPCFRLALTIVLWTVAHWLTVSSFAHWWGGDCIGPRLMADVLPGLFVLTLLAVEHVRLRCGRRQLQTLAAAFVLTGAFAVYVNSWQGLYNPAVKRWNQRPPVDAFPSYVFDWRYPQPFHDRSAHLRRLVEHRAPQRGGAIDLHRRYPLTEEGPIGFLGWSPPRQGRRANDSPVTDMAFILPPEQRHGYQILLRGTVHGPQRLKAAFNGRRIAELELADGRQEIVLPVDGARVRPGRANLLTLEFPDARRPNDQDPRLLALALEEIEVAGLTGPRPGA